jgi:hypothetical protein
LAAFNPDEKPDPKKATWDQVIKELPTIGEFRDSSAAIFFSAPAFFRLHPAPCLPPVVVSVELVFLSGLDELSEWHVPLITVRTRSVAILQAL